MFLLFYYMGSNPTLSATERRQVFKKLGVFPFPIPDFYPAKAVLILNALSCSCCFNQ